MLAIKRILAWLGSRTLLYAALVLAILASAFVVPRLKQEWREPGRHLDLAVRLEAVRARLDGEREATQGRLARAAGEAQGKSLDQLDAAIVAAEAAKARAVKLRRSGVEKAVSLATADSDALVKDGQVELEVQYRDREIAGLSAARERLAVLNTLPVDPEATLRLTQAAASEAMNSCRSAAEQLASFESRWQVRATFGYYDGARRSDLQDAKRDNCLKATAAYRQQQRAAELKRRHDEAVRSYHRAQSWTGGQIQAVTSHLKLQIAKEHAAADGSMRRRLLLWAERVQLTDVLKQAALALLLIMASPFLIRLFCYFVLAPLAIRHPAICIAAPGKAGAVIPLADRSTTSVGVRLAPNEELLVRQGYLQTTSEVGAKGTQWLLDWRHPMTSIASGMTFLTRVRGGGEVTTVSAVRDPFAEVTMMTLPAGSSCMLQPRALAAVAQPIGSPLRVTSHWRLSSFNAWLTLQLRYLVLHGPARLVLKGGRGVRVERAERGRVLGQDQVVGFSADLAYSVTRTETLWPYLFGREPLLKDRVEAGEGVLIIEEAPVASGRSGKARHGIEGMIDAGMKVFGM